MVKKISIVCLLVVALLFSGCRYEYRGEYLDLYTVAINSVLWTFGASPQTDFAGDPLIEIMEEDDFGRVLFRYTEKYFSPNISVKVLKLFTLSKTFSINLLKSKIPLLVDSTMEYEIGATSITAKINHNTAIIIKLFLLSFKVFFTFMFIDFITFSLVLSVYFYFFF